MYGERTSHCSGPNSLHPARATRRPGGRNELGPLQRVAFFLQSSDLSAKLVAISSPLTLYAVGRQFIAPNSKLVVRVSLNLQRSYIHKRYPVSFLSTDLSSVQLSRGIQYIDV